MKRFLVVVTLIVASVCVFACATPLTAGKIVDKRHEPAYYEEYTTMQCTYFNSKGICQVWMPVDHRDYVPDKYVLVLEDTVDGEMKQDDIEISGPRYDECAVGERYPECKPR